MASFFAFLATSSFIYIDHFGLTPTRVQPRLLGQRHRLHRRLAVRRAARRALRHARASITTAVTGYAAMALVLFAVTLAGVDNLPC